MSQPSKSVQRVRFIRLASPKKTLILEAEPDRNVYEVWPGATRPRPSFGTQQS